VNWIGHYAANGSLEPRWVPCTVEDVSAGGAGIVIYGGQPLEVGSSVVIDLERIGATAVGLRVRGVTRHVGHCDPEGGVLIGIELHFDTPHELRTASMLFDPRSSR
jgi:hypothetical protein